MQAEDILIKAPTLSPFVPTPRCRARGELSEPFWRNFIRGLWGKTPITCMRMRFCAGSKMPTEAPNAPGMIVEIMQLPDTVNECAGIVREHLHVLCARCGAGFLMKTKQQRS